MRTPSPCSSTAATAASRRVASYATGAGLAALALSDLNGDGKPDLTTANYGANTVSVLINRGDGSFAPRSDYATGHSPGSLALADLNGDHRPDLATANGANTLSVLLNRGDGSFEHRRDYATGEGYGPLAIADLNGDHKPDLATANGITTVSVLLNRGNGRFAPRRHYPTGVYPDTLEIADLNHDGRPDLAMSFFRDSPDSLTVSVLLNRGNGRFRPRVDFRTGGSPVFPISTADLNGDRRPDVLTSDGNTVSVLINKPGSATCSRSRTWCCRPPGGSSPVQTAAWGRSVALTRRAGRRAGCSPRSPGSGSSGARARRSISSSAAGASGRRLQWNS